MIRRILSVALAGPVAYRPTLEAQRRLARARIDGQLEHDLLLLLEHEPVVTVGRGARDPRQAPAASGGAIEIERVEVERVEIERGGDATYHGPGQLVGYPILDLGAHRRDLHWFVRRLEEALIRSVGELGLRAIRAEGYTGVWVGEEAGAALESDLDAATAARLVARGTARKLASIGVHVSRWVSWHGFALNVTREPLGPFGLIVPCGIDGVRMTSLEAEGRAPEGGPLGEELRGAVERGMAAAFETPVERVREETLARLREVAPALPFEAPGRALAETGPA